MGSAHPMDWIFCPVPSLVQSAVGEGADYMVETRGCGAGGSFKRKWVQSSDEGGNISRTLDQMIALEN